MYNTVVHRSRRLLASAERSKSRLISDIFHECGQSALLFKHAFHIHTINWVLATTVQCKQSCDLLTDMPITTKIIMSLRLTILGWAVD